MENQKAIIVAQHWQLELGHEIGRGVFEYARRKHPWRIGRTLLDDVRRNYPSWKFDALIFPLDPGIPENDPLLAAGLPLISTHARPDHPEIPQVSVNQIVVGEAAATFFLNRHYKQFAFVTRYKNSAAHQLRGKGFCDTLHAQGHGAHKLIFPFTTSFDDMEKEIIEWATSVPKPAALFCSDDGIARNIIELLHHTHGMVPDDIAILGCEDDVMICETCRPTLSSVHIPYRRIGFEAARLTDELLQGLPPRAIVLESVKITERLSTSLLATQDDHLRRAVDFIQRNICENITAQDAARHAGLSLRVLQKRFKTELDQTPARYIQHTRIEQAKILLETTDRSVDDIAEIVGYSHGLSLSKTFKALTGESPIQYRRKHRLRA